MPKKIGGIQGARAALALFDQLGLQEGTPDLNLDELVSPVVIIGDTRTSRIEGTGYAAGFLEAALAGENAVLRFAGTPNFLALPKFLRVEASPPGTRFSIRINTSAVSSVLTGPAFVAGTNRWSPGQPGAPARAEFGTFAGQPVGTRIGHFFVPTANEDVEIDLRGFRVGQAQEFIIVCDTNNTAVNWSVIWDVEQAL